MKKTTEQFIKDATNIHGDKYLYDLVDYKCAKLKVNIGCKNHGYFLQTPNKHLCGQGCPLCKLAKLAISRVKSTSEFIEQSNTRHCYKWRYDRVDYKSAKEHVEIGCSEHGYFLQTPDAHLTGSGCPKCASASLGLSRRNTLDQFISRASLIHNGRWDYSKVNYIHAKVAVEICCINHGSFWQRPDNHLSGRGCQECSDIGFKPSKPSIFYIYLIDSFVGFGITNNIKVRNARHATTFKKYGVSASLFKTVSMRGDTAQKLESLIKQTFTIVDTGLPGFRTEAIDHSELEDLTAYIAIFENELLTNDIISI